MHRAFSPRNVVIDSFRQGPNCRPFDEENAYRKDQRRAVAMFRLDYLSCFLTVVATILVGRKMWSGLVVSGVNSLIVCVIGLHTSQYGFIPANVFCICINAFNLRAWLSSGMVKGAERSESTTDASSELVAGCERMSTSKKAATRRLIDSCRIRSEGTLGNSISSLSVKGVWPSHQHPFAQTQTSRCPTLDAVSSRQEAVHQSVRQMDRTLPYLHREHVLSNK
jgi:hypothetical protein